MQLKDYYKTLEVPPTATTQEIKKSFRRLALKFHPDKNQGAPLAEAQFKEIQEAYEVLSDPEQRKEYNYKRWHLRSIGQAYTERPLTPSAILEESQAVKLYIDSMSIFRVDYDLVSQHIRQLISPSTIAILNQYNDTAVNRAIVENLLKACRPLPLRYFIPISVLLVQIAGTDEPLITMVQDHAHEKRIHEKWDIYKWVVMVIIVTLLIWLMYEFGK